MVLNYQKKSQAKLEKEILKTLAEEEKMKMLEKTYQNKLSD